MARQLPVVSLTEDREFPECRHHWVIQSAMGPVSQGVCQACGEVRDFKNYVESATWGDTKLGNRSRGQSKDDVTGTAASRAGDKEENS